MPMNKKPVKAKKGPGRPSVEVKKVPLQVMLDPRYIQHFRKTAKSNNIEAQDLARKALLAFVPDPFNPMTGSPEAVKAMLKKKTPK